MSVANVNKYANERAWTLFNSYHNSAFTVSLGSRSFMYFIPILCDWCLWPFSCIEFRVWPVRMSYVLVCSIVIDWQINISYCRRANHSISLDMLRENKTQKKNWNKMFDLCSRIVLLWERGITNQNEQQKKMTTHKNRRPINFTLIRFILLCYDVLYATGSRALLHAVPIFHEHLFHTHSLSLSLVSSQWLSVDIVAHVLHVYATASINCQNIANVQN